MPKVTRFAVSLEEPLFHQLEKLVRRHTYSNRSEYIRDLVRSKIVEAQWSDKKGPVLGTLTLVYDHHAYQLSDKLVELQHRQHKMVLAVTHVHLDSQLCAEMIMLMGESSEIRKLADLVGQQKGVLHSTLSISSTGRNLH